ncbi:MAG: DUF2130 domain-containing protein [Candidatus Sumerlaeaceae bacterium]
MANGQQISRTRAGQLQQGKSASLLKCPECGFNMELSSAFSAQVRQLADQEIAVELERVRVEATKLAAQNHNAHAAGLCSEIDQLRLKLGELQREQDSIADQRAQLQKQRAEVENTIRQRVDAAVTDAGKAAARQTRLECETREKALAQEVSLLSVQLKQAQSSELVLRKERQSVQQLRDNIELEICRRLDTERQAVAEGAREKAEQTGRLALQQKELQIRRLNEQIEKLQSSTAPRQPELQGESLEVHIKRVLSTSFPADIIEDVARGERGADLTQSVRNASLQVCGTIVWEAKTARNWNETWLEKLKRNQCASGGDLAVIVATVLPNGVVGFGVRDGVWVTLPWCAGALATALRMTILRVWTMQAATTTREERLRAIQNYLCSTTFRLQAEQLLSIITRLREGCDQEQRWLTRQWQKRKAALDEFGHTAAEIIGSLEAATGSELVFESDNEHLI